MARRKRPRPLSQGQVDRRVAVAMNRYRSGVAINIQAQGLTVFDDRLAGMRQSDIHELLESVGAMIESQTKRRISDEKTSPEGKEWVEWSERYAASYHGHPKHKHPRALRQSGRHSILSLDGGLHDSIMFQVSGDSVTIGSNLIYARPHQLGTEDIPARPYLGLSEENRQEVSEVVKDFVREVFW